MDKEQYMKNLNVPKGKIDVILDTDTYNEIDDQFALTYMLRSETKLNVKAICAAPFLNSLSVSPKDGMLKSYDEILKLLDLADRSDLADVAYKGSTEYLANESTPVISEAARQIAKIAAEYSPQKPLYVVAIGAITNVASAILINPAIAENIVIVWLGGHSHDFEDTKEFNMMQDIAAARVIFSCGTPVVQLPCMGVVSNFLTTKPELEYWLSDRNSLCDYLLENTVTEAEEYALGKPWSRIIWDVTAVAWLLNDDDRFMLSRIEKIRLPEYDFTYQEAQTDKLMRYVYFIKRDELMKDLFDKLRS